MKDGVERRGFKRFIQQLKVSYTVLSGIGATPFEYGVAETVDISRSGVRLVVDDIIEAPMLVQMHIHVPNRSYGLFVMGKLIFCRGVQNKKANYEVGIKFVGLLPADLEEILREVEKEREETPV